MSDLKVINKLIANVRKATGTQNLRIQTCAVMCIEHAAEHGDANPAKRLVEAVSPRLRAPLVLWFETYSRINITKSADGFGCNISKKEDRADRVEDAKLNVWFETAAARKDDLPMTVTDLDDKILSFTKALEKKLADGKVLPEDVASFEARVSALKVFAGQRVVADRDIEF